MRRIALALTVLASTISGAPALAQDAVAVDPKHYKVELDNDQVRVLRVTYGPGEKSVMHSHPAGVAIPLTDGQIKFNLADGKAMDAAMKAGVAQWAPAGAHLPENVGDKPLELILIELKAKP